MQLEKITQMSIELPKEKNDLLNAKQLYAFTRNLNPQFYVNKTKEEIEVELKTIQFLIKDIPQAILNKMCELAVKRYPKEKIKNEKITFNLDYVLSFYEEARFLHENDLTSLDELWTDITKIKIGEQT